MMRIPRTASQGFADFASFRRSMTEVLQLTRAGRPGDATSLIRTTMTRTVPPPPDEMDCAAAHAALLQSLPGTQPVGRAARTAAFTDHLYTSPEGVMRYKLYRPAGAVGAMPLVVMLHGCTQTPDDFARGTGMNHLADQFGLIVAYPEQSQGANANRCWNWFRPGDQGRGHGEPALISGITRQVITDLPVDAKRVYVAGLSAGGAAAAIMGANYADLYAAIGIHSGLAAGAARNLPSALSAMKRGGGGAATSGRKPFVPVITFHGDSDTTVAEINSREIVDQAAFAAGVPLTVRVIRGRSPGGRSYTQTLSEDVAGHALIEQWTIAGGGHAWSGGDAAGSYTDPHGPDASREMLRFLLSHKLAPDQCSREG